MRQNKVQKITQYFGKWICYLRQVKWWGNTELGPVERAALSHWAHCCSVTGLQLGPKERATITGPRLGPNEKAVLSYWTQWLRTLVSVDRSAVGAFLPFHLKTEVDPVFEKILFFWHRRRPESENTLFRPWIGFNAVSCVTDFVTDKNVNFSFCGITVTILVQGWCCNYTKTKRVWFGHNVDKQRQ